MRYTVKLRAEKDVEAENTVEAVSRVMRRIADGEMELYYAVFDGKREVDVGALRLRSGSATAVTAGKDVQVISRRKIGE